jgi:hypothetical protein
MIRMERAEAWPDPPAINEPDRKDAEERSDPWPPEPPLDPPMPDDTKHV